MFRNGLMTLAVAMAALAPAAPALAQITFEDVYAAPDDQDLNLAYARQQAQAGELLGAVAALERMLYSNPDWDSARLFYAGLLVRLDDVQGARREVGLLRDRPLGASQRAELDRIAAALSGEDSAESSEVAGLTGQLSLAARYDDDAGGVFGDVLFGGEEQGDESVELRATLQYFNPVAGNVGAYLRGEMGVRRHEDISDADYDIYGAAAGLRGSEGALVWATELDADFVDIATEDYLDQYGVNVRLGVDVGETATLSVVGSWRDQSFKDIASNPAASLRSGDLAEIGPRLDWRPTDALRLRATGLYQNKSADSRALAYDGWKLDGDALWRLGPDVYASAYGIYRELDYKADSPFVFPAGARADDILRLRGALGVRLSALRLGVPGGDDITVEFAVNHLERGTNIPGGDFSSTGGEVRLVLDF